MFLLNRHGVVEGFLLLPGLNVLKPLHANTRAKETTDFFSAPRKKRSRNALDPPRRRHEPRLPEAVSRVVLPDDVEQHRVGSWPAQQAVSEGGTKPPPQDLLRVARSSLGHPRPPKVNSPGGFDTLGIPCTGQQRNSPQIPSNPPQAASQRQSISQLFRVFRHCADGEQNLADFASHTLPEATREEPLELHGTGEPWELW